MFKLHFFISLWIRIICPTFIHIYIFIISLNNILYFFASHILQFHKTRSLGYILEKPQDKLINERSSNNFFLLDEIYRNHGIRIKRLN